jgi:phosphatidylserine/phosphatidylglycerophosphate/cardiolipin synthase-like enzyme
MVRMRFITQPKVLTMPIKKTVSPVLLLLCVLGALHSTPPSFFRLLIPLEEHQRLAYTLLQADGKAPIKRLMVSPRDSIKVVLMGLIGAERKAIKIAIYMLNDKEIADALIARHQQGLPMEIIVCRTGSQDRATKIRALAKAGIKVYVYPRDFLDSLMHHKVMLFYSVFGRSLFITGSYNLTPSAAAKNQENLLFLEDAPIFSEGERLFEELKGLSVLLI